MGTENRLTSIPLEVWELITGPLAIRDLPSLLLSSKHLNEVLTPTLYSHIQLNDALSARMCITTLAAEPDTLFLHRNLVAMVHTFCLNSFDMSSARKRDDQAVDSLRRLERVLCRMSALRRLVAHHFRPFTPSLLTALFRGAASTIQAIHIELQNRKDWLSVQGSEGEVPEHFRPTCPDLTVVDVWVKPGSQLCGESSSHFLRGLLASHAAQIRTLAFVADGMEDWVSFILSKTTRWPVLERLEVDRWTLWEDALQSTPEVRVLAVRGGFPLQGLSSADNRDGDEISVDSSHDGTLSKSLPRTAFPKLEELHCAHDVLPAFLSSEDQLHRPIRKLELDDAYFWSAGRCLDYTIIPTWREVRKALTYLPNSGGPVKELAFIVCGLDFERFASTAGPYLRTLEKLLLVMYARPIHVRTSSCAEMLEHFGERLFAQMPCLHTFQISEGPYNPGEEPPSLEYCGDSSQQLRWLKNWEVHAPALATVALCKGQIWEKTQRGWEISVADTAKLLDRSAQRTTLKSSIVCPLAARLQRAGRMPLLTVDGLRQKSYQ
ncbi:hypothetical protein OH77DRAFT_1420306 [Trametes cingulata]|nr:hypothetical protein OH77DRAFT_1420306 [Trametes cingulata]